MNKTPRGSPFLLMSTFKIFFHPMSSQIQNNTEKHFFFNLQQDINSFLVQFTLSFSNLQFQSFAAPKILKCFVLLILHALFQT